MPVDLPRPRLRRFTVEEARALIPAVREHADALIEVRAELTVRAHAHQQGGGGGIPEIKALEARMGQVLDWFPEQGIQVKGYAPLLLDFPSELAGEDVLLCWLEGDESLEWFHHVEHGFMGRRRIDDVADTDS